MLSRWSGRRLRSKAHRRLIMQVADEDKSVRHVPGHVLPVERDKRLAKRITRLGHRGVAQRADVVKCKLPAP